MPCNSQSAVCGLQKVARLKENLHFTDGAPPHERHHTVFMDDDDDEAATPSSAPEQETALAQPLQGGAGLHTEAAVDDIEAKRNAARVKR